MKLNVNISNGTVYSKFSNNFSAPRKIILGFVSGPVFIVVQTVVAPHHFSSNSPMRNPWKYINSHYWLILDGYRVAQVVACPHNITW